MTGKMKQLAIDKANENKEGIKINYLKIEDTKKVKAVVLTPSKNGLTIIGGKNENGKTSVLSGIAWACGGNKKAPSDAQREGSLTPPQMDITFSNGIKAERSGKNSSLKVTDTNGVKAGQTLLDSFISEFALDLPKFMNQNDIDKAKTLLKIIGVGDELVKLDMEEKAIYAKRTTIGQIKDSKIKHSEEMQEFPNVPELPISASELIKSQQLILAKNGENQLKRNNVENIGNAVQRSIENCSNLHRQMEALSERIELEEAIKTQNMEDMFIAEKTVKELEDESTIEIEKQLNDIETTNSQVRANMDKSKAIDEANEYSTQYTNETTKLEDVRKERLRLLSTANLPLPGLSVRDNVLTYKDKAWDCMSGSEQLKVAVAIVRRLNPDCGFVLIDKLEQMDIDTLNEFGLWLESEGLQAIATRVSTGEECSIIIEDGLPQGQSYLDVTNEVKAETFTYESSTQPSWSNFKPGDK